jgi:hypothetical protein
MGGPVAKFLTRYGKTPAKAAEPAAA